MKQSILKSLMCVLLIASFNVSTANEDSVFIAGNKYYDGRRYDSAIFLYSILVSKNVNSPLLFYNLGNAFYKNRNFDSARHYYTLSLKANPGNRLCIQNLLLSERRMNIERTPSRSFLFESGLVLNYFSIGQMINALLGLFFAGCVFYCFRINDFRSNFFSRAMKYTSFLFMLLCLAILVQVIFKAYLTRLI